jgi:acyl-CoA thioesterase-2
MAELALVLASATSPALASSASAPTASSGTHTLASATAASASDTSSGVVASSAAAAHSAATTIESVLVQILDLEEIDRNLYRGYSPAAPRWGRVYGGQTVAQALAASYRTVPASFVVHSLHAYFLRAGDDNLGILYYVERLRDGRSLTARRVTALQRGEAIFAMNVSFMTAEGGREHQDPMPMVPPPEEVRPLLEQYQQLLSQSGVDPRVRAGVERSMALPFPVDMRRITPESIHQRLGVNEPKQVCWMRVKGALPDSLMIHQCALAYMSDWNLLETALLPHALHNWMRTDGPASAARLQMASIDHSMWFHHAFRADEWLLYDMISTAASNGRGFTSGKFFDRRGRLIVSTAQEGLIRVIPPSPSRPPTGAPSKEANARQAKKAVTVAPASAPPRWEPSAAALAEASLHSKL